ncbi:hypothetical protein CPLU01_15230 [Colletotrichum plurivorum]|uniref:Ecp2 effector protein domain-containing protein n=1 Tax=Colletotrichum plurivorum TaxID=2175906 RepID=A0A8H6JCW8_9PEZI|nr:hypothetical protein CPLU01_15230 [Colletotrichum plurivorum]
MHVTQTVTSFLLRAALAAGMPQPERKQPYVLFQPPTWCKAHRPAKDELSFITFNNYAVTRDDDYNIISNVDGFAYLLDQSCSRVIQAAGYLAYAIDTHAYFNATLGMSYDGVGPELGWQITIESHTATLGAQFGAALGDISIRVNGEEKWQICSEAKSDDKLGPSAYKVCNFKPGSVWPKSWWPYGNGFD